MNIIEAIKLENIEEVKKINMENPNAIDEKDEQGIWAPFIAAQTGNLEIVKYIVEYTRASMNVVDDDNRTILHYAVRSNNVDLVYYLVERVGMSIFHGDKDRITPYEEANLYGAKNVEEYFESVCGAKLENMYKNPIVTGTHPDPSIIRVGDDYYMVNSSFIFFPCIPISHSKDLVHWKIIGHAITKPEYAYLDELQGGRGYWAPDISYYDGRFYITATYRLNDNGTVYRKQMVTSSVNPEGPYCEPVFLDEDGIDPSLFTDDDGRRYMILNRGARIFELDKEAKKIISEPQLLWYGDNKRAPEGAHLLKKGGYYYLFVAEGGTGIGHRISVARSKNLMGPYESCPYNPIMRQLDEKAVIQRAGHGKPVQTQNGEWYMVYLCGRMIDGKYSILGRETAMDPMTWTPDNWPIINELKGPSVLQKKPNLSEHIWNDTLSDDFNGDKLGLDWMFPRPPKENSYYIKDNCLYLKGDALEMNDNGCRSIVVRRQKDFCFTAECKIYLSNMEDGQNMGMTCYYDENTYLKFGVFGDSQGYSIKVEEWIDDVYYKQNKVSICDVENIELKIETKYLERIFYYRVENKEWIKVAHLSNVYYLCDEGIKKGKRFTGAMIGMYAYSGNKSEYLAKFEYFNMKKDLFRR
ncbi:family 43 glycosylhydrolase [Clostridium sp.]|uniref:family 43 glycosylhydrolase n=1 Tax=Clostridium sp. TaxID=1506 RepID=UPI00284C1047|nr:family 43 glycosylhydrolase [Clostridium sp.]MDR3594523.1 family 43 glycosylhydrolase [Clostridium sp.]